MDHRHYLCCTIWLSLALACPVFAAQEDSPVEWSVKPDPLPTTMPGSPLSAAIKPSLSLTLPKQLRLSAVPSRPSRFIMTTAYDGNHSLWDLGTGAKAATFQPGEGMGDLFLSPDGRMIASLARNPKTSEIDTLEICSIKPPKRLCRIELAGEDFNPKITGFVGDNRILVLLEGIGTRAARVYDVNSGKETARLALGKSPFSSLQLSHQGKYAVNCARERMDFFNTATGRLDGRIVIQPLEDAKTKMRYCRNVTAFAFSPDGKELAVQLLDYDRGCLALYNVSTGQRKQLFQFKTNVPMEKRIEYLPDNSGWLIGCEIFSRAASAFVYRFPMDRRPPLLVRAAGPEQVLVIDRAPSGLSLRTLSMPTDTVTKVLAAKQSGGKVEDADLPPLAKPDTAAAQDLDLASATATPWAVKAPMVKLPAVRLAKNFCLAPARDIEEPGRFVFTSPQAGKVFIEGISVDRSSSANYYRRTAVHLECFDLGSGARSSSATVPAPLALMDASPSGQVLLFVSGEVQDRLDVYRCDRGELKHLAGFRPLGPEQLAKNKCKRQIVSAAMVDDSHALVLSARGLLSLWEVPACKQLWRGGLLPKDSNQMFDYQKVALSPDRRLAVIPLCGGRGLLLECLTGKALNILEQPDGPATVAYAFSPDSSQLAAFVFRWESRWLRVYDLATGKMASEAFLPQGEIRPDRDTLIQFPSPGYVLVGDSLVNLDKKAVIWRYVPKHYRSGVCLGTGSVVPYQDAWFLASDMPRKEVEIGLTRLALPDDAARNVAVDPADLYVWYPGMKVSLSLSVVGDQAFREQEIAGWTQQLKSMGFEVADKASAVLTVDNFLVAGQPVTYEEAAGRQKVTFRQQFPGYRIHLRIDGKEVWKAKSVPSADSGGTGPMMRLVSVRPGETLQQAANRENPTPKQVSQIVPPPPCILKDRTINVTEIGPRGL